VNQNGEEIVKQTFEPREKLARAILQAGQNGSGAAFLDLRPIGRNLTTRLPQTCELLGAVAGIDPSKQPVPILPAAHRSIGGVESDAVGHTSVSGLFAVGECACNGLNGAGRLAGNTLIEALVFGRKAGEAAAMYARSQPRKNPPASRLSDEERRLSGMIDPGKAGGDSPLRLQAELGKLMNERVGLIRDNASLRAALDEIRALKDRYSRIRLRNTSRIYNSELTSYLELGSLLNIAELVTLAAQERTESRGAHWRSDFPQRNDSQWSRHTIISQVDGRPYVGTKSGNSA
jgi:succinate dehydrogenase/fumarate reductase flavoprotein subunit